ncbi:MAG: DUF1207 domain-containing protein [Nitrospira sp.]|nr:DUF1207 domain-containing protein [bacterium]MBL7049197.1 DUF1207 domain-containing protein [Nitrospira sp.]
MKLKYFRLHLVLVLIFIIAGSSIAASADDDYIRGFAEALLKVKFSDDASRISVKEGVLTISPGHALSVSEGVLSDLSAIDGVVRVEISGRSSEIVRSEALPPAKVSRDSGPAESQSSKDSYYIKALSPDKLFDPLMADPRWPHTAVLWHNYISEAEIGKVVAPSIGAVLPLYRGAAQFGGDFQIGMHAAFFGLFDLDTPSWDLLSEDYRFGLYWSHRKDTLSTFFSIYHLSSHIGDELLLRGTRQRTSISYEAVEFKVSKDFKEWLRVYAGGDYLFSPDPEDIDPWFAQYGVELKSTKAYYKNFFRPIAAIDVKHKGMNDWNGAVSLRAGVEISNEKTLWHKVHIMLEYFNGNSPNSQFYNTSLEYTGLGAHFYF